MDELVEVAEEEAMRGCTKMALVTGLAVCWIGATWAMPPGGPPPVGWNELHHAVRSCDPDRVQRAIGQGLDPNACTGDGHSAMEIATLCSQRNALFVLDALWSGGATLEAAVGCGVSTPLHQAALRNELRVVDWLLDKGLDVNARGGNGGTALHTLAAKEYRGKEAIAYLLGKGADIEARQSDPGRDGLYYQSKAFTPLLTAANFDNLVAIRVLLDAGAEVDARSKGGQTALIMVAENTRFRSGSSAAAMDLLLDRGADASAMDGEGETALRLVLKANKDHPADLDLARKLVAAGADLKTSKVFGRYTYLGLFCETGNLPAIAFLLKAGVDVIAPSWTGKLTPLHLAARGDQPKAVDLLLARGAALESLDDEENTPLHLAADDGQGAALTRLVAAGAKLEARNKWGQTPLFLAARSGNLEQVRILIGEKVDLNARADDGRSPISAASAKGYQEVVQALLAAGARKPKALMGLRERMLEEDKADMRENGKRAWARVIQRGTSRDAWPQLGTDESCRKGVRVRFKTPADPQTIGVICHPFTDEQWRRLKPGARLEVVYLPDSLMKAGRFSVAAEVMVASFVEE